MRLRTVLFAVPWEGNASDVTAPDPGGHTGTGQRIHCLDTWRGARYNGGKDIGGQYGFYR